MSRRYLVVMAVAVAVLYGSTYQQFRYFTLADPGGASDAVHYVDMARGVVPANEEIRHYRWLTPTAAGALQPLARLVVADDELSMRLAFYAINFTFSLVACLALFRGLQILQFSPLLSLLGVAAFASSRVTVLATGTPLVDAAYFCAIAVVVWLTLEGKAIALAIALPLLVFSKETIIPFLLLPLLTDLRRQPIIWVGLLAAAVTFAIATQLIASRYPGIDASYVAALIEHARDIGISITRLLTLPGLHDLQNGFSLFLPLAVAGAWLNARHRYHDVPLVVVATVPIAFVLALLSGNLGRMFFAAFPAVIAYALIAVEHVTRVQEPR